MKRFDASLQQGMSRQKSKLVTLLALLDSFETLYGFDDSLTMV